jgi:SAM-dependent methyltransferase
VFSQTADLYDAFYSWKDYEVEAERVHSAIEARKLSPGRGLLDVACGTGHHLEFLKRWYDCQGCDLDPAMLALARARLPELDLFEADMNNLDSGRAYDAVVCLFSSIGYARDPGLPITAMARHLVPGGVLLVEPWLTPEQFETGKVGAIFVDREDVKACRMNSTSRDGRSSRLDFEYLVGRGGRVEHFTESHQVWLHTEAEYRGAFGAAGLEVELDPEGPMGRGLYIGLKAV